MPSRMIGSPGMQICGTSCCAKVTTTTKGSVTFTVFFTVYNMYIWALAIAYTPTREGDDFNRMPGVGNGDVELEGLRAV